MPRPIVAQIHPAAVSHNLSIVKQRASRSRAWAVVKANAYGHGIDRIFPALANADGIALLDLDEAVRVRELGWTKPILLLEGVFKPGDVQIAQQFDLSMAVHCREQLDLLRLSPSHERVKVHLKMNSGMNRLGFRPDAYRAAWEEARSIAAIADITLMSHFANADDGDVAWQMDRFDAVTQDIPGQRSLANSAAVLWHPQAHRDWVRPGVVLYGGSPTGQSRHIDDVGLRASMTLRSEVIGVQSLLAEETVGYGRAFAANREMRIGVVACGYADGYPRHASTGTPISIDGVMTQVVGRVSMDMLTVDLTPCPHAQIGSKVELWGEQVKIDDVAHASGTIGYELMCALAKRVPVEVV
ncbi:Alanine racemase, catabolic [Paraburkholderia sediminicola]|uniref:Alanine racemase n=1 Tax=Paraburkholderia sediminicola TaxID=458836 RepID=A0A6J5A093_9BURK|nr:alanine racemase [Paraburkholderia sediminicola]CAB3648893.1 Alanine racemase, catabolic [Paraburkholderia sediminicola]